MSITCDRCSKPITSRRPINLKLGEYAIAVLARGTSFGGDGPDLCSACLVEIAKNGEIVERESLFEGTHD